MIKLLCSAALGWLRKEFGWFALLAIGIAAASTYVAFRQLARDRDALLDFATVACASAGEPFAESTQPVADNKGEKLQRTYRRGQLCTIRIAALDRFETKTAVTTAQVIATHQAEQDGKTATDASATRDAAARRAAAQRSMEKRNAQVGTDDRVDGNWFAGINDLAGMHADD